MRPSIIQENALRGECVAFTGILRDADRRRTLEVVTAAGGVPAPRLTRKSTLLVVGMRGWRTSAHSTINGTLRQAEIWQLDGRGPRIISERSFWARVSGQAAVSDSLPVCTVAKAADLTGLTAEQLRRCAQLGLVRSEGEGLCFEDLLAVRVIMRLLQQGVTLEGMAAKWADLSSLLPEETAQRGLSRLVNNPVGGLALLLAEGVLVGEFGQLLFDFPPLQKTSATREKNPVAMAAELIERGEFTAAEAILRRNLSSHPQQLPVLAALGKLLVERERYAEAESLLRRVLASCPEQTDTLFALALCCEELRKRQEAISLWRSLLRLAPTDEQAIIAKSHLLRPVLHPSQTLPIDS